MTEKEIDSPKRWWWIGRVLSIFFLMFVTAILLAAVVVPRISGAVPYTVLTASMKPTYPPGTLVIVKPLGDDAAKVGAAVTYQLRSGEPEVVTHRIVATSIDREGGRLYTTQGDNNPQPDAQAVKPGQIRGQVWYSLPYMGYVNAWLTGGQRKIIVGVGVGALLLYAAYMFAAATMANTRRRHNPHEVSGE
ncbi:signal peptidase I [Rhodococcus erythropolis]